MNETMCFTTSTLADAVTVCCIRCNVCREHGRVCGTVECATAQRRQQRARHPNAHPPADAGIREQAQTSGVCVCVCKSGGCARGKATSWGRATKEHHTHTHTHAHTYTHTRTHTHTHTHTHTLHSHTYTHTHIRILDIVSARHIFTFWCVEMTMCLKFWDIVSAE